MCDSTKYPYPPPPPPWVVLLIRPSNLPGISVPEGSRITPPPRNFIFLFHDLNLQHLEIIDRVLLKMNCPHLKKQFFIFFDLFVIFYQAICISYTGRAWLIDYEQSLSSFLIVSPARKARKQRLISLCHLKKTFTA